MLKLLIADDEKMIREAVSELIDWGSLGIELIGTAENGLEALNMILDEYPDIVMTDIKMPGLSGIELISKIYDINKDTHFIILTGFGEFEYAKQAMQYGVKHYLLKPCDEKQIINSVKQIKIEIAQKAETAAKGRKELLPEIESDMIYHILREGLSWSDEEGMEELLARYEKFLEPDENFYEVIYAYYLPGEILEDFVDYVKRTGEGKDLFILYVKNTLLLFFRGCSLRADILMERMKDYTFRGRETGIELKREQYSSYRQLVPEIIRKVKRYEYVYFGKEKSFIKINNQTGVHRQMEKLLEKLLEEGEKAQSLGQIYAIVHNLSDQDFVCRMASSVFLFFTAMLPDYTVVRAYDALYLMKNMKDVEEMKEFLTAQIQKVLEENGSQTDQNGVSIVIKRYVEEHLADTALSLKWISEHILFMNVDYVSKKFLKETGQKFSAYLAETRIHRAKQLLMENDCTMNEIAEQIGCGNNPQYFGQLFRKYTGIPPSRYYQNRSS